jgi:predicted phosphodiesterase
MIYVIISDIHGNLEAFNAVIESFAGIKAKKVFCAGDVVGYGADPEECIEKIKRIGAECILGNHDAACVDKTDIAYFNPHAREAVLWTKDVLSTAAKDYLKTLPYTCKNSHFTASHGTLHDPEEFIYMMSGADAMHTFELLKTQVCFVGHSHVPGVFSLKEGKISYSQNKSLKLENGFKYIVNAGSVGQPRDYDRRACYCVYDVDKCSIKFERIEYDVEEAQQKIIAAGLPAALAERLAYGQ